MPADHSAEQSSGLTAADEYDQGTGAAPEWLVVMQRKRWLLVIAACPIVALLTLAAIWYGDRLGNVDIEQAPVLSPDERFAQECQFVREQKLDTFHVSDFEVNDQMLAAIEDLDWIDTVILDRGTVTDDGLEAIAKLPNLKHLRLRLSPITDEGLKTISSCQSLWYLNLPHADCSSAGVAQLQKLTKLRQLRLGSQRLTNDVTQQIASLQGLRGIHLIGVPVTDDGLETLATMPYLESLYLDDSAVTEAGWERLFRRHPDLHVHVNQRHHDRDPKGHNHHD